MPSQVVCPHCNSVNRVPTERLADRPACGRCKQPLFAGHPVELTQATFADQLRASDLPVVVDFWAPWCGPCRAMAPHYDRAASMLEPQVRVAKLNTEDAPAIAAQYQIRSIPTLAVFRGGVEVARTSGAMPAEALVEWVRAAL